MNAGVFDWFSLRKPAPTLINIKFYITKQNKKHELGVVMVDGDEQTIAEFSTDWLLGTRTRALVVLLFFIPIALRLFYPIIPSLLDEFPGHFFYIYNIKSSTRLNPNKITRNVFFRIQNKKM